MSAHRPHKYLQYEVKYCSATRTQYEVCRSTFKTTKICVRATPPDYSPTPNYYERRRLVSDSLVCVGAGWNAGVFAATQAKLSVTDIINTFHFFRIYSQA